MKNSIILYCQSSTSVSPKPGITVDVTKLLVAPSEPGKTNLNSAVFDGDGICTVDLQRAFPSIHKELSPGKLYEMTLREYTPTADPAK